jgi:coproporphyrinogen III oxidase
MNFTAMQTKLIKAFERLDSGVFRHDTWTREHGHGQSSILENSVVIERGAVLRSELQGLSLPSSASASRPHLAGLPYQVQGVSVVIHPQNPFAPTGHLNIRQFITEKDTWVGGGMDLTPHYLFPEDAILFHQAAQVATQADYQIWKQQCDAYFWLKHRSEARGIGGVFFDDYTATDGLELLERLVNAFISAYCQILERRKDTPFTPEHRAWQVLRRGRYAEFNLVWDRGTAFGLQSGGRIESILASMPPLAAWQYNVVPQPDSPEMALLEVLRSPRNWL